MTGDKGAEAGSRHILVFGFLCLPLVLLLPGCSDFRQILGMDRTGPDEFAVESRAPLTVPPDFDLRPPQPGAARPQEVTAADKAKRAIDTAGPGKPGDQATFALKAPSSVGGGLPDTAQGVAPDSLASKLLGANDTAGTTVRRETSTLKGVY
ncbi:MAG TPA: DUF3035 domain-containing protein [Stellaceae bacterium]|nr:DUF3035 domain-containing protein [Stellaceae bacterium]